MPFGFPRHESGSDSFLRAKRDAEALAAANLRLNPRAGRALSNLGLALSDLGCFEEALLATARATTIDPVNALIWHNSGVGLYQLNLVPAALRATQMAIRIAPSEPLHWCQMANVCGLLHRPNDALVCCDRAKALNPAFWSEIFARGIAYSHLKRYPESLAAYERLCAMESGDVRAWNNRGHMLVKLERSDEAVQALDEAIRIESKSVYAWVSKADALIHLGRHDDALAVLEHARTVDVDHPAVWTYLGIVRTKLTRYDDAQKAFDRALLLDPDQAEAWAALGDLRAARQHYDDAVDAYERSLALDPDEVAVWRQTAAALHALGRPEEALAAERGAAAKEAEIAARQNAPTPPPDPAFTAAPLAALLPLSFASLFTGPPQWTNFIRRVLAHAKEEAERLGDRHVGDEHLLLGMLAVPTCMAAEMLRRAGVTLEAARDAVRLTPGRGPTAAIPTSADDDLDLSQSARDALTVAAREATRLATGYIATQHLLLALTVLRNGAARPVLDRLRARPTRLYDDTLAAMRPT